MGFGGKGKDRAIPSPVTESAPPPMVDAKPVKEPEQLELKPQPVRPPVVNSMPQPMKPAPRAPMPLKHANNGKCEKCAWFFDRYPGFHEDLRGWFEAFQAKHPEAHISCAGRGRADQELAVKQKLSRAHYGQSAHNWNCAIDFFVQIKGSEDIYPRAWFYSTLQPALPSWLKWYGEPGSSFFELPHVEVRNWRELRQAEKVHLVE